MTFDAKRPEHGWSWTKVDSFYFLPKPDEFGWVFDVLWFRRQRFLLIWKNNRITVHVLASWSWRRAQLCQRWRLKVLMWLEEDDQEVMSSRSSHCLLSLSSWCLWCILGQLYGDGRHESPDVALKHCVWPAGRVLLYSFLSLFNVCVQMYPVNIVDVYSKYIYKAEMCVLPWRHRASWTLGRTQSLIKGQSVLSKLI